MLASKRWGRLGGVLVAACLLAACGSGGSDGSPSTTAAPSGGTSSSDDAWPRTVGRDFAETKVPAQPQRVVATADRDQLDVLLAMGIEPVLYGFSGDYEVSAPWIDPSEIEGLEKATMASAFEPNLERIAAARPDLIVDAWSEPTMHDSLSQIAPTVQIKIDNTDSWRDAQLLAGAALGQEEAADEAIAETEAVIASQAERLDEFEDLKVAVAYVDGGSLVVIPGDEIGGRIIADLGVEVLDPPGGESGRYSLEEIPELLGDADVILSFNAGGGTDSKANALFAALPAVQAGGYVPVDQELATAAYQESTLSLRWAAEGLTDAILAGANGEGDTLGD